MVGNHLGQSKFMPKKTLGEELNGTIMSPTSCLLKLSHTAMFPMSLKDRLSGDPFRIGGDLLKPREMMFIGSAWSATSVVCQGTQPIASRVSVPSTRGTVLWEHPSSPPPIPDSGLESNMWPAWE